MRRYSMFDNLADSGSSDLARWRDGVVLPILLTLWGLFELVTGHSGFGRRLGNVWWRPSDRALGLLILAVGVILHSERFWATDRNLAERVWIPRVVAGSLVLGALAWLYCWAR